MIDCLLKSKINYPDSPLLQLAQKNLILQRIIKHSHACPLLITIPAHISIDAQTNLKNLAKIINAQNPNVVETGILKEMFEAFNFRLIHLNIHHGKSLCIFYDNISTLNIY